MAARKTKDDTTEAQDTTVPGTNQETGAPGDLENVKTKAEAQEAAVTGEGDTTTTDLDAATKAGYYGTSPAREQTGADDKGLSQANASVMNQEK